jgi:diaminopimelate decarboxylase
MEHFRLRDGVFHCEDVPLPEIARAVGTPAFVYSTAAMRDQARLFRSAVAELGDPLIAYAVKANPNGAVLATLAAEGLGADVVSIGEYRRAVAAGIAPHKIVFSGVGKTAAEMAAAIEGGLFQFNLESLAEAEMLSRVAVSFGQRVPVAFRVNPDVDAGSHAKISTGAAHNKFGIPIGEAGAAFARVRHLPGLEPTGVAVHIGSQLTSLRPLERAFGKVGALITDLRAAGHDIRTADLGGGLGVRYDPAAPTPPSPADYGAMVARVTRDWDVRLIFEPGRLIVGEAGVLLTEVIRIKPGAVTPFVILDSAMNDLMRPTLYDAWHGIEAVEPRGERMLADLVGPVCETGDTFARDREVDRVEAGDLMIIRTAGAYAATMANTYNSRPLAPEVLVDGERWAVVRARKDVEALMGDEMLPDWLHAPAVQSGKAAASRSSTARNALRPGAGSGPFAVAK